MLALLFTLLALHGTTATTKPDIDPAWSADGKYVAFARLRTETSVDTSASIWIVGRDGRGAREVTPDFEPSLFSRPAWSPDGGWLAFQVAARYSPPSVDVVRTDGRDLTQILDASGSSDDALWATWSPDGKRLALSGNVGIYLANRDVWQAHVLNDGRGYPSWSPDSSRIVFVSGETLAIVAVDSGTVTQLPAPAAFATWAPDGTRIAYTTGCQVGVVSAGATGKPPPRRSCRENTTSSAPSWSPDGRSFAYSSCVNSVCGVYVAPAAQPLRAKRIARGDHPVWSPDGRRIAYARMVGYRFVGIWLIYPNGAGARRLLR
jgi:Tol biopolymer transport system component